ncbi:hypothetical protein IH979_00255 [Patescibacteria group bacterium]|nr:hypothetical protein [Patescibacteria group bacterium]
MIPSDLAKTIYRTVAYFFYFEYPLTGFEIWKWQMKPVRIYSLDEILQALASSSWLAEHLERQRGFFTMAGSNIENQIHERRRRFLNAVTKQQKLRRVLWYLSRLPHIQGIALCNSIVFHHTRPESDIDLFVLTKPGRLWLTRLFSVSPFILLQQRPGETKTDPVDLSFFVATDELGLEALKIDREDPYLSLWTRSIIPVYEREAGVFETFFSSNLWAAQDLPATRPSRRAFSQRHEIRLRFPSVPLSEKLAARIQQRKFPNEIKQLANQDSRVVVTDRMLKFHKNDRRLEIARALRQKMTLCEPES